MSEEIKKLRSELKELKKENQKLQKRIEVLFRNVYDADRETAALKNLLIDRKIIDSEDYNKRYHETYLPIPHSNY